MTYDRDYCYSCGEVTEGTSLWLDYTEYIWCRNCNEIGPENLINEFKKLIETTELNIEKIKFFMERSK